MRASKLRGGVRKARESPQARSEGEARNLLDILRGVIRQGGETLWVFPMLMLLGVFRFIRGIFRRHAAWRRKAFGSPRTCMTRICC